MTFGDDDACHGDPPVVWATAWRDREISAATEDRFGPGLLVCLDRDIGRADAEPLALGLVAWHAELAPAGPCTVVFRDSGFADDVAKSNLAAILHQHGLSAVRSL